MQKLLSYFSFQGRANRQRYWLTNLSLFGLMFVSALFSRVLGPFAALLVVPLWLALFVVGIANGARRLHDRAKSVWWLLVFVGVPFLLLTPAELMQFSGDPEAQAASAVLSLLSLPFSIWGFVVMGCLKGTTGPNRFGDDPLQPPVAEAFA